MIGLVGLVTCLNWEKEWGMDMVEECQDVATLPLLLTSLQQQQQRRQQQQQRQLTWQEELALIGNVANLDDASDRTCCSHQGKALSKFAN
jgi:hypothetical protein